MAIRKGKEAAPASLAKASLGRRAGLSSHGGQIALRGNRDAWTYCASPTELMCAGGKIVPWLAKAWHTPGLNGNGRSLNTGDGFIAALTTKGMREIPHEIECVAFGEVRTVEDYPYSTYIVRHEAGGKVWHGDAWHRPRSVGVLTVWDFDAEGWFDFLERCLAYVWPGEDGQPAELDPVQVEIATLSAIRAIRSGRDRQDPRGQRAVLGNLRNLPKEHAPPDILPLYEST